MDKKVTEGGTMSINPLKVDRYYFIRVVTPFSMPCGATVELSGKNQKCPNSGKCPAAHGECWVEFYAERG